jgi:predicted Zn-dependent protease
MPVRIATLLLLLVAAPVGARPDARVPLDGDEVLERLPAGYATLTPGAAAPADPVARADALLAGAARTGDARLARRAAAILAAQPPGDDPASLRVRAAAAQSAHDFETAAELLGQLVRSAPHDGGPLLARAQVRLVQGRVADARRDCAALALGVDPALGLACATAYALRTGDCAGATALAERFLRHAGAVPALQRYVMLMRAEASARRGDPVQADLWFRVALRSDPGDVRTRAAYAAFLVDGGRPREARRLLADAGDGGALPLLRTMAATAAGDPDAPALADALARTYRDARRVGQPPEPRDEAVFLLHVAGDAAAALPLAQANFAIQRDHEDVVLLARAAAAARVPEAFAPAAAWAASAGLPGPSACAAEPPR